MKVRFWGTRGSIPSFMNADMVAAKVKRALMESRGRNLKTEADVDAFMADSLPFATAHTYGMNTSCVEIEHDGPEVIILDAGSGIRDFGFRYARAGRLATPATFHIFMTHLHWDHIQGFPFFAPIYVPGNRVIIHGYHDTIPDTFREQMQPPTFPLPWEALASNIEFDIRPPLTPFDIAGFKISSIEQNHPGIAYGYRFEKDGQIVVYSSDSEHKDDAYNEDYPFVDFFRDANVVIFDAQYSLADATFTKANWGHSSNVMGVELAARAHARHLCLFHNEPTASDEELDEFLFNSRMYGDIYHSESSPRVGKKQFPERISIAYDGMVLDLDE